MDFQRFTQDRDSALRSLDREKIVFYARKYGVILPAEEKVFWAGVHKARLEITTFSDEEKAVSDTWLQENGFKVHN